MDDERFLDEFRPFRRGELALARRTAAEPDFLAARELDLLRYALRLAQLSTLRDPDDLVERIGSFRLRLLQLLGPALPTDPGRLDAAPLRGLAPRIAHLVAAGRRQIVSAGLSGEHALDEAIADKRVALVMGGAGGAGFVLLGALAALEEAGITPSYLLGTSIGALIGALRARTTRYDLPGLLDQAKRIETGRLFGPPQPPGRYGLPGALRFDPRAALAFFFTHEGEAVRLPAHLAWRALEGGRIGTRNVWIAALDALVAAGVRNRLLLPMQRVLAATLQRDRAYWDLYVPFRDTPFVLDIVPRPTLLAHAAARGRDEMAEAARILRAGTAPLARWSEIEATVPRWG